MKSSRRMALPSSKMGSRRARSKKKQQVGLLARRKEQYRSLLARLGFGGLLDALPREFCDLICINRYPIPDVKLDSTAEGSPEAVAIRDEILKRLQTLEVHVPSRGVKISLNEFFTFLRTVHDGLERNSETLKGIARAQEVISSFLGLFERVCSEALSQLTWQVIDVIAGFNRFDEKLFGCRFADCNSKPPRLQLLIHLEKEQPRVVLVPKDDGETIRAYQVGSAIRDNGVDWLSWRPDQVGLSGQGTSYPVFISSHALRKFDERIDVRDKGQTVRNWIFYSLRERQVEKTPSHRRLVVAQRIGEYRLGYWCIRFDGDRFIADTFLFLTMEGTPESEMLKRKLGVLRRDREWLGLDKLSTFLTTDVRNDRELVKALGECGCGHLFELAERVNLETLTTGTAEAVRQYLGMRPSSNLVSQMQNPGVERRYDGGAIGNR